MHSLTAIELQKQFCSLVHDIRNPLASMEIAVRGLGILASETTNDQHQFAQYLQVLQLATKRLGDIAHGVLAAQGHAQEQPTIFSLHAVIDELLGEYQSREDMRGVTFVKRYHPHAIELYGVRARLERAAGNIVKNAIEAMQRRGTLTVVTEVRGACVTVALTDTGPGMSPTTLAKVLRGGHTEGKQDGHGIGTQVVRDMVESLGGRVEADSVVGQGTTFRLVLPLPSAAQRETAERETLALQELVIPVPAGADVLVVDDEPSMREQWRLLLAAQGTAVRLCTCYEDVVAQGVEATQTPTAIVDYHFANSIHDGLEVVRYLQAQGIGHCLLCTAEYWRPQVQDQAKTLGMQLCPKPVPERIVVVRPT